MAHWALNLRYAVFKTQRRKIVNFGQKGYYFMVMSNHDMLRKLHSELALQTELQLDRVGVDFVFPPSQLITRTTTLTKIYQKEL